MDFDRVVEARRSVRLYKPKPLDSGQLSALKKAIMQAPSAHNMQSFRAYLIESDELKKDLAKVCRNQTFIHNAAVVFVFCAEEEPTFRQYGERSAKLYPYQDAAIACTYAMLKAVDLGLASCWIGSFDDKKLAEFVSCPASCKPVAVLPIGFPAQNPKMPNRKNDPEIFFNLG